MLRSCWNHFTCFSQIKITNPELFRNMLKIILVGTGNVLSPHKYFQFERTLKNVVVNSESAFWDILWWVTFWDISKRLLEGLGDKHAPHGGPPRGLAGHMCGAPWSSTSLPIMPFMCDIYMGILGFCEPSLPLGFPINRGGVGSPNLIPSHIQVPCNDLASLSLPAK